MGSIATPQSSAPPGSAEGPASQTLAFVRGLFPGFEILALIEQTPRWVTVDARDLGSGSVFRIHVLPPAADEAATTRFREIGGQLVALEHPALARVYHAGFAGGHPCLFTERPTRPLLGERLGRTEMRPEHSLRVVPRLCEALEVLHGAGIPHLAVDPFRIDVADDLAPRLFDAGLAVLAADSPERRIAVTKALAPERRAFLAPEQTDSFAEPDARSDVFALGAILYRMLTGRNPGGFFVLPSSKTQFERRIDDLVSRCLQDDPADRYQDVADLHRDLAAIGKASDNRFGDPLTEDGATGGSEGGWMRHHSLTGERIWRKLAILATTIVVVGAGAWALYEFTMGPGDGARPIAVAHRLLDEAAAEGDPGDLSGTASEALRLAGPSVEVFTRVAELLRRSRDLAAAVQVVESYLEEIPEDHPERERLARLAQQFVDDVTAYRSALERAKLARETGDDAAEEATLREALGILPAAPEALDALHDNPIALRRSIEAAARDLRNGDDPAEASIHVTRGFGSLDLSGNHRLTDLGPLAGVRLDELDVSETAVSDLGPLAGMLLQRIWFDDTRVTSLAPLAGMPLVTLACENAPVADLERLDSFDGLRTVRFTGPDGPVRRIAVPEPERGWENALGMRFVPVEGPFTTPLMVSRWETRVRDFSAFKGGGRVGGGTPSPSTAGAAADPDVPSGGPASGAPATADDPAWKSPRLAPSGGFPVADISWDEADAFCDWLTARDRQAGFLTAEMRYRLPTDAEWSALSGIREPVLLDPAARALAGAPAPATASPERRRVNHASGQRSLLTGLAGNVREWTNSPPDPSDMGRRTIRGGSSPPPNTVVRTGGPPEADSAATMVDLRDRTTADRADHADDLGFRVVLELSPDTEPPGIHLPELVASGRWDEATELATRVLSAEAPNDVRAAARDLGVLAELRAFFKERRRVPASIRSEFVYLKGRRYLLVRLPLDHGSASAIAREVGGHLVTLNDREKRLWVRETFAGDHGATAFWTDAIAADTGIGPEWRWASGGVAGLPDDPPVSENERLVFVATPSAAADDPPAPGPSPLPASLEGFGGTAPAPSAVDRDRGPADGNGGQGGPWRKAPAGRRHFFLIEWG